MMTFLSGDNSLTMAALIASSKLVKFILARTQYPFLENTLSLSTEKLALKNEGLIFFCTFIYD